MAKKKILKDIPFEEIFDSIPDGIIITDKNLAIISINESSENILNISRSKASGNPLSKYFPKEITNLSKAVIKNQRIIHEDEITYRTPLNSTILIECIGSPIYKHNGEIDGLILQIKDKEKMNLLSKIQGNEKMEENYEYMLRGMAHELNNPLSGIKGAAQLLSSKLSSEEVNKCSDIIIKEVDRLKSLIDRLRRLDSFERESFEPVNIHEILLDIIFLESNLHDYINFDTKFDITIPPVSGDQTSLKQVFINIIKNAIDSIGKEGSIEIKTKWVTDYKIKSKNNIEITIKDNGQGIQRKNLKKIFTPFFSNKKGGSGLGLFISNQIIAKHGGVIMVESEIKKGTKFKIHLPVN